MNEEDQQQTQQPEPNPVAQPQNIDGVKPSGQTQEQVPADNQPQTQQPVPAENVEQVNNAEAEVNPEVKQPKKKNNSGVIILAVIILVGLVGVAIYAGING